MTNIILDSTTKKVSSDSDTFYFLDTFLPDSLETTLNYSNNNNNIYEYDNIEHTEVPIYTYLKTSVTVNSYTTYSNYAAENTGILQLQLQGCFCKKEDCIITLFKDVLFAYFPNANAYITYKLYKHIKIGETINLEVLRCNKDTNKRMSYFYVKLNDLTYEFYLNYGNIAEIDVTDKTILKDSLILKDGDILNNLKKYETTEVKTVNIYGEYNYFYRFPIIKQDVNAYKIDTNLLKKLYEEEDINNEIDNIQLSLDLFNNKENTETELYIRLSDEFRLTTKQYVSIICNFYKNDNLFLTKEVEVTSGKVSFASILLTLIDNGYLGYNITNFKEDINELNKELNILTYAEIDLETEEETKNIEIKCVELNNVDNVLSTEERKINILMNKVINAPTIEGYTATQNLLECNNTQTLYVFYYKKDIKTLTINYIDVDTDTNIETIEVDFDTNNTYIYPKNIDKYKNLEENKEYIYGTDTYNFYCKSKLRTIFIECVDSSNKEIIETKEIETFEDYVVAPDLTTKGYMDNTNVITLTNDTDVYTMEYTKINKTRDIVIVCLDKSNNVLKSLSKTIYETETILLPPTIDGYTSLDNYKLLEEDVIQYTFIYSNYNKNITVTYYDKEDNSIIKTEVIITSVDKQVITLDNIDNYKFVDGKNILLLDGVTDYSVICQKIINMKNFTINCLDNNGENIDTFVQELDINTAKIINAPDIEGYVKDTEYKALEDGVYTYTFTYKNENEIEEMAEFIFDLVEGVITKDKITVYYNLNIYNRYTSTYAKCYAIAADLLYKQIDVIKSYGDGNISYSKNYNALLDKITFYKNKAAEIQTEEEKNNDNDDTGVYLSTTDGRTNNGAMYDDFYF